MVEGNSPRVIWVRDLNISNATKKEKIIINAAIKKVLNYFGETTLPFNFTVKILNTRGQMDFICGYKTPDWLCGNSNKTMLCISIFQEDLFERLTTHRKSEFGKVLTHEITHLYIKKRYLSILPLWLHEGIAMVIANQKNKHYFKKDIRLCHNFKEWKTNPAYHSSYYFTKYLVTEYGKKKLFLLLENDDKINNKDEFYSKFKKIYQNEFDFIVEKWLRI